MGLQLIDFELYLFIIFKLFQGMSFSSSSITLKSITWSTLAISSSVFLISCLAQPLISPLSITQCRISWQKFSSWKLISKQCFLSAISFLRQKATIFSRSLLNTSSSTIFQYILFAMVLAKEPMESRLEQLRYFSISTIIRQGSFERVSRTYLMKVQTSPKPSSSNRRFYYWYCQTVQPFFQNELLIVLDRSILVLQFWMFWQVDSPRLTILRQYQKRVECSFFSKEFFCSCSVVSSKYSSLRIFCNLAIAEKSYSSLYCRFCTCITKVEVQLGSGSVWMSDGYGSIRPNYQDIIQVISGLYSL